MSCVETLIITTGRVGLSGSNIFCHNDQSLITLKHINI